MRKYVLIIGLLVYTMVLPLSAQMAWQGAVGVPGNWTNTANWSGGVLPTLDDYANLDNGGIAVIDSAAEADRININSGKLELNSGGDLDVGSSYVGQYAGSDAFLEVDGGTYTYTNAVGADLNIGYNSGSTGKVTVLSGTMNIDILRLGYEGTGLFVLSNGTVTVNSGNLYLTSIGTNPNSTGTLIQDGGTLNYPNTALVVGKSTGSRGRYVLNDGVANIDVIYTGWDSGSYGEAEFRGGSFDGEVYAGSCPNGTGVVSFINTTNTLDQLRVNCTSAPGGGTAKTNSTAILTFTDSVVTNLAAGGHRTYMGYGESSSSTVLQDGGLTYWNSGISVGYSPSATATYTLTNGAVLKNSGYSLDIGDSGNGRFNIHGGDVSTELGRLQVGDTGTGVVEITEGSLTVTALNMPESSGSGTIYLKGGTLKSKYKLNVSWQFYVGGKNDGMGQGYLMQSGGTFLIDTNGGTCYLGNGGYEISGGSLVATNYAITIQNLTMPNVPTFRVKGSDPIIDMRYLNGGTKPFYLEYILDKSDEHIAPINFYWDRAYRCGHLCIGLDGGVMLSKDNSFRLMNWNSSTSAGYGDYLSKPDPNMWTETLTTANPAHDDITLANGYKMGNLDFDGTTSAQFAEQSMGHVTVENISKRKLVNLVMRMAVTEKDKNLSEIVDDLVDAGYTNSIAETSGIYNLKVAIPAEYVVDSSDVATSYFAWDFTDTTSGTTNATVTAIEVQKENLPPVGTLIIVQ